MTLYFAYDDDPTVVAETEEVAVPAGTTEITQAAYDTALLACQAGVDAQDATTEAGKDAEAQAAYDEIVGIHPIAALALAKLIYPPFTP